MGDVFLVYHSLIGVCSSDLTASMDNIQKALGTLTGKNNLEYSGLTS